MTFQKTPNCHKPPLEHTIPLNGALRIDRAGRVEATRRPEHGRHADAVDRQEHETEAPQREGSPKRANRCLCNVARHTPCNSANDRFRQSRFGKTRNACPGTNAGRSARPSSRKSRFARFRRTAVPNRRPMTIPICVSWETPEQTWRLNSPVETRRPCFLMCWISPLRFKKNGADTCPAVITHLPAGYLVANRVRPEITYRPIGLRQTGSDGNAHPGRGPTTRMFAYMQIA